MEKWSTSVNEAYHILDCNQVIVDSFFYKLLWRLHVPTDVMFFVWGLSLDRLSTLDNLRKRDIRRNPLLLYAYFANKWRRLLFMFFSCVDFHHKYGINVVVGFRSLLHNLWRSYNTLNQHHYTRVGRFRTWSGSLFDVLLYGQYGAIEIRLCFEKKF